MPPPTALLIAPEAFQDAAIPPVPHAEADAARLAAAIAALGYAVDPADVLAGNAATKTRIESRLRKRFRELADGRLLVVYLGRAFGHDGETLFAAADTISDEPADTAVSLSLLYDLRKKAKGECLVVADGGRDGIGEDSPLHEPPELAAWEVFAELPKTACLLATQPDEFSYTLEAERSGAFMAALLVTLADVRLRDASGALRLSAVRDGLVAELPRFVRKAASGRAAMTPTLLGDDRLAIAQIDPDMPGAATLGEHWQHLRQVVLRTETRERTKTLRGVGKGARLPDRMNAYAETFLAQAAAGEIADDLAVVHAALREQFHYKRKDLETTMSDDGRGTLRTPDFDYTVSVGYEGDDLSSVLWRREVAAIRRPDIVQGPAFQEAFGKRFGALVFEFESQVDLEQLIDTIEEQEPAGVTLDYPADVAWLELRFRGFAGQVRIGRNGLEIQGRNLESAQALIGIFFEFQRLFKRDIALKALPFGGTE